MRKRKYRYFVGDFETTVYKGQVATEVWASASVELYTENVNIFKSIHEQFEYFKSLNDNIIVYYHNLKFDGAFWLHYLLSDLELEQAYEKTGDEENDVEWIKDRYMKNNTFKYTISDLGGQWYTITIKINNKFIVIRDSLKLLPFSLARIGKAFQTKHQKLDMEYEGFRYSGMDITQKEREYIRNDVLVIKEALEIMFDEGHSELTIGSCCLKEYKSMFSREDYEMFFPDLSTMEIDEKLYGSKTVDEYIRKSYKGGWCYLVKGKENKRFENGTTADVNSLYPSVMSGESGNKYPLGLPYFWKGDYIPDKALGKNKYFFVRVKTRFKIKEGMLPFIQIKSSFLYKGTEMLETSDILDKETNEYISEYKIGEEKHDTFVTMTLTMTDYKLLKEHYHLIDFEILDGCWFYSEIGIFDRYIEKYKEIKLTSKGAKRELAKLFLNNLYGKMASSTHSNFKVAYLNDNNVVAFKPVSANDKKAGYIPVGSAITSYARDFTIRVAQQNYFGKDKRGFIYADTDSIHCDLPPHKLKGLKVHPDNFNHWSIESEWEHAYFIRQKTYIEYVIKEDMKEVEPHYIIKCAGMPEKCKDLFLKSVDGYIEKEGDKYTEEEKEFLKVKRDISDFKVGLVVPGKLTPKRVIGGVILNNTTYELRP